MLQRITPCSPCLLGITYQNPLTFWAVTFSALCSRPACGFWLNSQVLDHVTAYLTATPMTKNTTTTTPTTKTNMRKDKQTIPFPLAHTHTHTHTHTQNLSHTLSAFPNNAPSQSLSIVGTRIRYPHLPNSATMTLPA